MLDPDNVIDDITRRYVATCYIQARKHCCYEVSTPPCHPVAAHLSVTAGRGYLPGIRSLLRRGPPHHRVPVTPTRHRTCPYPSPRVAFVRPPVKSHASCMHPHAPSIWQNRHNRGRAVEPKPG